jgi:phage tail sheath protein FI
VTSKNTKKGTFNLSIRRGDDTSKRKTLLESFTNLSLDPNASNYIAKVVGDSSMTVRTDENLNPFLQSSGSFPNKSKYVRVDVESRTPDYLDSNGNITANELSQSLPAIGSGSFQGGTDGTVQHPRNFNENITSTNSQGLNLSNAGGSAGYDQYIEALNILKNQDEYDINMILMPGVIDNLHGGIVTKAMDVVEDRSDAFLVVDPVEYGKNVADATTRAEAHDNNYTSMYWPWVQVPDTQLGKNVWVPPSTVMGGIISFNDKVSHPWFAPAGLNRGGIDVAIQAERKLTQSDRDTLYDSSVNPIATFPGQGVVVFGQKTLQKKASALDRVNVRRLLIRVKKFIASSSRFLVFEQNSQATRRRFLNIVNPFLEQIQANSGLSAFRVVMDETNNTPDQIDRNILYGQIFVQPTRTAEFIVLDFTIQPTGATFPE